MGDVAAGGQKTGYRTQASEVKLMTDPVLSAMLDGGWEYQLRAQ